LIYLTLRISVAKSSISKSETKLELHCLNRLNQFIKVYKDKNKKEENNVVYKILCNECDTSNVRQTKSKLGTRERDKIQI